MRIVEEVELISMLNFVKVIVFHFHMRKQLVMVGVVRGFRVPVVLQYSAFAYRCDRYLKSSVRSSRTIFFELATCRPGETSMP
ncbi:MAG: hypothetical protein ACLR4A_10325, partial [Christensenellales bacterium]